MMLFSAVETCGSMCPPDKRDFCEHRLLSSLVHSNCSLVSYNPTPCELGLKCSTSVLPVICLWQDMKALQPKYLRALVLGSPTQCSLVISRQSGRGWGVIFSAWQSHAQGLWSLLYSNLSFPCSRQFFPHGVHCQDNQHWFMVVNEASSGFINCAIFHGQFTGRDI